MSQLPARIQPTHWPPSEQARRVQFAVLGGKRVGGDALRARPVMAGDVQEIVPVRGAVHLRKPQRRLAGRLEHFVQMLAASISQSPLR